MDQRQYYASAEYASGLSSSSAFANGYASSSAPRTKLNLLANILGQKQALAAVAGTHPQAVAEIDVSRTERQPAAVAARSTQAAANSRTSFRFLEAQRSSFLRSINQTGTPHGQGSLPSLLLRAITVDTRKDTRSRLETRLQ